MLKKLLVTAAAAMLLAACDDTAPATQPPPPPTAPIASYMVFFDWDSTKLNNQSMVVIGQAAQAFKTRNGTAITATGHTDTTGSAAYNMALSLRRANAVKDALVQQGVPATAINAVGVGFTQLLVKTPDGVREPQNRRVEMVIQGMKMDDATYCAQLAQLTRTQARGSDPTGNVGKALSNCQTGTGDFGIPFMVQYLTDNRIPVPPRG